MCKNLTAKEGKELQEVVKCEVVKKIKYLELYFTCKNRFI